MYLKKNNNAFTLIELVVVIGILAILATIGFMSFGGKLLPNSRDTTRISNLQSIYKGLNAFHSSGKLLSLPENSAAIKIGGKTVGYQGTIPKDVISSINGNMSPKDEFSKRDIIYRVNAKRTAVQIMTYLESPHSTGSPILSLEDISPVDNVHAE